MKNFSAIHARAARRKGGSQALEKLLPAPVSPRRLAKTSDDRCLSLMSKCVFRAGFSWKVIDRKWPDFEQAFHRFDPVVLVHLSPDTWDAYLSDTRIVRNWQKIKTVYDNACFVNEVSGKQGSFARFLAEWPQDDQVGLMAFLKENGSRLGGNTGQYFLRFIGRDTFILSGDVIQAIQEAGVDIGDRPSSQRDLGRIQEAFNTWHDETGLPYSHLSKIAAYTCGVNYDGDTIIREMQQVGEETD